MSARPVSILRPPVDVVSHRRDGFVLHRDPSAHTDERTAFALSLARGLDRRPRALDARYLYDAEGSEIFERITETPEYYQTRTEDRLLEAIAPALRAQVGDVTVVELGSGSSSKTRRLLSAFGGGGPLRYVPIDISAAALEPACAELAASYPALGIEGVAASYDRGLSLIGAASPLLLLFLGSSIGNLDRAEHEQFLANVADRLSPGDRFLIGIDLVKDPAQLEAAYNDAAGWSARFTLNLFARANRELAAGIPLDALEHVAFYDDAQERIEIHARARRGFTFAIPMLQRRYRIAAGEMLRTEISCKYRPEAFAAMASRFGFVVERIDQDPNGWFALVLLRRWEAPTAHSPLVARRAALEALLRRTRGRTYEIIAPLSDEELARQPHPVMGPLAWDLCHVAAFEQLWLVDALASDDRRGSAGEGLEPQFDALLTPRAARGGLALPTRTEALKRLETVRAASLARLQDFTRAPRAVTPRERLLAGGFVCHLVAQHEAQHQETMLQAIQMRDDLVYTPPFQDDRPPPASARPPAEMALIPAGPCLIGSIDPGAYDNERPPHEVQVPAFRIDIAPVTNGDYLRFIEAGGYDDPTWWSTEGWTWRTASGAIAPLHWRLLDGVRVALIFGRPQRLDLDRPVVHVSWYEAHAFARWRGLRLPREVEWEKAAAWDPERGQARRFPWGDCAPTPALANLDGTYLEPVPVGTYPAGVSAYGCHQMVGDVWEWTADWFQPYPGFEAFPYPQYSAPFFGETHRVLRGGSWATAPIAIRNSFRNWDLPERRQIFAGFRCATDA